MCVLSVILILFLSVCSAWTFEGRLRLTEEHHLVVKNKSLRTHVCLSCITSPQS